MADQGGPFKNPLADPDRPPLEDGFDYYEAIGPEEAPLVSSGGRVGEGEDCIILLGCTIITTFILGLNLPDF